MKQFPTIFKFELKTLLQEKSYKIMTILGVMLILLVMFFPRIVEQFENKDGGNEDRQTMLLAGEHKEDALPLFEEAFPSYDVQLTDLSIPEIENEIRDEVVKYAFDLENLENYRYFVKNVSLTDSNLAQADALVQMLYRADALTEAGLSPEEVALINMAPVHGEVVKLGKDQAQNYFYTYILLMFLYMVIIMYGMTVAMRVATEKSSRAMELLITSADPLALMFGKIIAACLAGFIQMALLLGTGIGSYFINKEYWEDNPVVSSMFEIPPELLAYMLVFFFLGFFLYAFLFGAAGSLVSKIEQVNTVATPITFLLLIGFMGTLISMGVDVDNLAMKILSFIPFTSPMAMFTRIAMSTVAWYEIAISIGLLIITTLLIGVFTAKVYRIGVLLYGTPPKPKALWKALRRA
jgi:ABC-2 type transport system permease protein